MATFFRRRPALGLLVVAALGAVALPAAAHPAWPGGASAPARYLFPALPLLAAVAAAVWRWDSGRGIVVWVRPLLLVSVLLAVYAASVPGQYLYLNQKDGTGRLWEALGTSWDLTHYLPSILRADARSLAMAGVGVALLLSGFVVQVFRRMIRLPSLVALVLLGTVAIDFVSPGHLAEDVPMRRMERLMWGASEHRADRFVSLPAARLLGYQEVVALIDLPLLEAKGPPGSAAAFTELWTSTPIRVPAGRFVLEAGQSMELELCNGEGCFEKVHVSEAFSTRVGLFRFRVRAGESPLQLRLRVVHLEKDFLTALQTVRLPSGARLHALDDNVYFEPPGFWVRAFERAGFALEQESPPPAVLSLANGGVENWIAVEQPDDVAQFSLRPFEARRLEIQLVEGLGVITVGSAAGFRPVDQDPSAIDYRPLGVFVTAPGL